MVRPHYFLHGNLVFGSGPSDAWAAYRLDGQSYPGLSLVRKLELKNRIEAFAYSIEADFQLIRSARRWSTDAYVERAMSTLDPKRGDAAGFHSHLEGHRRLLEGREIVRHETYLLIRLAGAAQATGAGERIVEIWRGVQQAVGLADARGISNADLDELRRAEERAFDRVREFLTVRARPLWRDRRADPQLLRSRDLSTPMSTRTGNRRRSG